MFRKNYKKFILLTSSIFLISCTTTEPEIKYINVEVDKPKLSISQPSPVSTKPVEFLVITEKNFDQYKDKFENGDLTIIGMKPKHYRNMADNVVQLRLFIKRQNSIIAAYRDYYETEKEPPQN